MADDGLEWLLSLDVQQDDAISFLKTLDKMSAALKVTKTEVDKVEEASGQAGKAHKKHEEHADRLTGAFHKLVHSGIEPFIKRAEQVAEFEFLRRGVDAIIDAPRELIEKVTEIGKEALNAAAAAERMDLSFRLKLGREGAEDVLGWIDKIASKTAFTDDSLKGFANEFLRAGVAAKDLDKYVAAAGDLAAMGADAGTAVAALSRANLTGKIEGRALRTLGIPIKELAQFDRFKGLSETAINKRLEKSTLSRNELLRLIAGSDGKLGDKMVEAGKTLDARMKNLRTLPEQFFQRLSESPAYDRLKEKLGEVFDALDPNSARGQRIFDQLDAAFGTVVGQVKKIDFDSIAETLANDIVPSMRAFVDLTKDVAETAGVFKDVLDFITPTSTDTRSTAQRKAEGRLEDPVNAALHDELKEKLRRRRAGIDPVYYGPNLPGTERLAQRRKDLAGVIPTAEQLRPQLDALKLRALSGMDVGRDAYFMGEKIGGSLVAGARGPKGLDEHSPSKKFQRMGELAADGFAIGFGGDGFQYPSPKMVNPGMGGGTQVHVSSGAVALTIQIGQGSSANPDEIARAIKGILPGALISAFEQTALETGGR